MWPYGGMTGAFLVDWSLLTNGLDLLVYFFPFTLVLHATFFFLFLSA